MMTPGDMDWGDSQWDVDSKAESLNKSLFGGSKKTKLCQIKADQNLSDKKETSFAIDSDDDETFTKKAKKKLKERRRMENRKNKADGDLQDVTAKHKDEGAKNKEAAQKKSIVSKSNTTSIKKQKGKKGESDSKSASVSKFENAIEQVGRSRSSVGKGQDKDGVKNKKRKNPLAAEEEEKSPVKLKKKKLESAIEQVGKSRSSVGNGQDKDGVKNKKRKNPLAAEEKEKSPPVKLKKKKKKTDEKGPSRSMKSEEEEEEPKKKRKRMKKKKPNSKRNKYAHLGLKSKSSQDDLISDNDSGDDNMTTPRKGKRVLTPKKDSISTQGNRKGIVTPKEDPISNSLRTPKGKKRKNSLSVEEQLPSKKIKVFDKSEKSSEEIKVKTKKKSQKLMETSSAREVENNVKVNGKKKENKLKVVKQGQKASAGDETEKLKSKKQISEKLKTEKKKDSIISGVSNAEKLNTEKKKKKNKDSIISDVHVVAKETDNASKPSPFFSSTQGSELQQKMVEKLASARFRFINEQLYTIKGGEAFRMFQQDKTLMDAYNTGFQGQVKQWSVNPLDVIIKQLNTKSAQLIVADFGCGEARLSASVPQKVHSFDLFPLNERVTVCDMAKTPLADNSVNIAVFCLSLMGTNLKDYILEANRILKDGGLLKIAEVVSRFTNPNHFVTAVSSMGFRAVNKSELSTMFYLIDFKKVKRVEKSSKQVKPITLKPCVYKKR